MKKLKKMIGFAIVFVAFAASVTAFANSVNYATTLPNFGHKTVVEGTKSTTVDYAINTTKACESNYVCWVDYNNNGSWVNCMANQEMEPEQEKQMKYVNAVPSPGTAVRLRTQPYGFLQGGKAISGTMNFN